MKATRLKTWKTGLVVIFFCLFSCQSALWAKPKYIKIGSTNPMSGPGAKWGKTVEYLYKYWVDMTNDKGGITVKGKPYLIKLIIEDDKYNADAGRAAAEKLIYRDKVKFMVGTIPSVVTLACAPLLTENKIINICGGAFPVKPEFPYLFRCPAGAYQRCNAVIGAIKQLHPGKIHSLVSLNPSDESGKVFERATIKIAPEVGLKLKEVVFYERGAKDFYPQLTKIIAAQPDMIFGASPPGDTALIIKQARELGYKGVIANGGALLDVSGFIKVAGRDAMQGYIAPSDDYLGPGATSKMIEYRDYMVSKGGNPKRIVAGAYLMCLETLTQAIEKANSFDPDKIKTILETARFDSQFGRAAFSGGKETYGISNHTFAAPVQVGQVTGNKIVHVGSWKTSEP